jgi:TRAP-type C4-dicarboxylate transport system substrate-binding protein
MKKLTKTVLLFLLALTTILSFTTCSKKEGASQGAASQARQKLRYIIGSGHTARSLEYLIVAEDFLMPEVQKRVSERTNYDIEWVPAFGTIANLSGILNAVKEGLVEFGFEMTGSLAGQLPYHNFSTILPFTTNDPMVAKEAADKLYREFPVLTGMLHDEFNQTFLGVHGLADYGIFSTYPISSVKDVSGKKIGGSGRNLLWLEGTGATPIQSNLGDGYTSFQTKLIDGQFCAASWGILNKFPEVAKFYTDAGLGASPIVIFCANNDVWEKMPAEVKPIFEEVVAEYMIKSTQMSKDILQSSMDNIKSQGGTIVTMTNAAKQEWCKLLPNLPDVAKKELGDEGLKIVKRYMEILKEMGQPVAREWTFPIGQ